MLIKVIIESEGDVNGFFTLVDEDGSVRKGWSCDQGRIEMDEGDEINPHEYELCFNLWFAMDIDESNYESRQCSEWNIVNGFWTKTKEWLEK